MLDKSMTGGGVFATYFFVLNPSGSLGSCTGFNSCFKALKISCISSSCLLVFASCSRIFFSNCSIFNNTSLFNNNASRIRLKMRMIYMFTSIAVSLFKTLDNMATPCSANTLGSFRKPIFSLLDVTFCDFHSSNSFWDS
jgi:hypothetical protein